MRTKHLFLIFPYLPLKFGKYMLKTRLVLHYYCICHYYYVIFFIFTPNEYLQSVLLDMRTFCTLSTTILFTFYLHYIYILNHLLSYFILQLATTISSTFFLHNTSPIFNFFSCHYTYSTTYTPTLSFNLPLQFRLTFSYTTAVLFSISFHAMPL
jgi:hypothetical protein